MVLSRSGGGYGPQAPVAPFSTTFPATEAALSQGGIWTLGGDTGIDWKNVKTVGGTGAFPADFESGAGANDCIAHLKTSYQTFNANQWAEGTVYKNGSPTQSEIELHLRFQTTANNARGYEVYWSINNSLNIFRWNGAYFDFTGLVNVAATVHDGDVLRAEVSGSTITCFINGSQVLQTTDATWSTGQPGLGFTCAPGGVLTDYGWKSFRAGNL